MAGCNDSSMETFYPSTGLRRWRDAREPASSEGAAVCLAANRAYPLDPAVCVRCVRGNIWVTQEGDARDIVLAPGEQFVPARRGKVVIQALSHDAAVRLLR